MFNFQNNIGNYNPPYQGVYFNGNEGQNFQGNNFAHNNNYDYGLHGDIQIGENLLHNNHLVVNDGIGGGFVQANENVPNQRNFQDPRAERRNEIRRQNREKNRKNRYSERSYERFEGGYYRLKQFIGSYAYNNGVAAAQRLPYLGVTEGEAKYWKKKYINENLHNGTHGGQRNFKFPAFFRTIVESLLLYSIIFLPDYGIKEYAAFVSFWAGAWVDRNMVQRILSRQWGCTWKLPVLVQVGKFTYANLMRYFIWNIVSQNVPRNRLKYADEAHFEGKLYRRRKTVGRKGQKRRILSTPKLIRERYTGTFCIGVNQLFYEIRRGTNDSVCWITFVLECIENEVLVPGDVFCIDNAPIHTSGEAYFWTVYICSLFGILVVFLPAYCCECNPTELVINKVKNNISHRGTGDTLLEDIENGVRSITVNDLERMMSKSLDVTNVWNHLLGNV